MTIVKGVLLGSAAGLLCIGAAQAADLPVKAKAVEYVKVCSLYGAGFYYIPGTDTCIKLGGYLRAEAALGTNADYKAALDGIGGARNRLSNGYTVRSRQDLTLDTRTATEYGVVRTYFEGVYNWTNDSISSNGAGGTVYSSLGGVPATNNASTGLVAGGSFGLYFAFIQFAGFTIGKAQSQFDAPWGNYPGNIYDALPGGSGTTTGVNQFTYTADFGQGVSASISVQDQVAYFQTNLWNAGQQGVLAPGTFGGSAGGSNYAGSMAPDIVGTMKVDQAWGLVQASLAAHDNRAGYYGADETTGHPSDKWGWAGQLALSIKNLPTGPGDVINVQGVYTYGATRYNFQNLMPINYAAFGTTSMPGVYRSVAIASIADAVYAPGTGLDLTSSYGVSGGYTHNWNPQWFTSIYGAWAAVRYGNAAKGMICNGSGFVGLSGVTTGVGTCNPDFNMSTIGVYAGWTPVKNLTFSADLAWTNLEQKYSGVISTNAPSFTSAAKPTSATYELKNQNSLTLLLRAQRNW